MAHRKFTVRSDDGKHLFTFDGQNQIIEIRMRGSTYQVPLWQLQEFLRTSQRDTLKVYKEYSDALPCGHEAGTVEKGGKTVCAVCGKEVSRK